MIVALEGIMGRKLSVPKEVLSGANTPIDLFAAVLAHNLKYEAGERDMVVLSHELTTLSKGVEEVHTSVLYLAGDEKYSAMAKTVGLPVAISALLVLDGEVGRRGVMGPGDESVRVPVLRELGEEGVVMEERRYRGEELEGMRERGKISRGGWVADWKEVGGV